MRSTEPDGGAPGLPLTRTAEFTEPAWSARWAPLARGVGLAPGEPVLVALSGGADSVLLLHLVAASEARPRVFAVHLDHGLRGQESREDAAFCATLCRELCIPLRTVELELEDGPDLEARARRARYRTLAREARRRGVQTVLTGHHADDSIETLLLRWTRGVDGLSGPEARLTLAPGTDLNPTSRSTLVARPLLGLRRSDIRQALQQRRLVWREDSSNEDRRFTRNRIRHGLLPTIAESCGDEAVDHLLEFGRVVARLEDALAERTSHLAWRVEGRALATRGAAHAALGGRLARSELAALPRALQRRGLVRLLAEGTGRAPGTSLVELLLDDLSRARCTRRTLPDGWVLVLRSRELLLLPPAVRDRDRQHRLPFPHAPQGREKPTDAGRAGEPDLSLHLPGTLFLPDGRAITAWVEEVHAGEPVSRDPNIATLDAAGLPPVLTIRFARSGDRFHPIGGPGSRPLGRFLADAGIPREERSAVPLVFADEELVWVAGVRPCERHRVRPGTARRLLIRLGLDRRGDFSAERG